ncbi:MAG: hypothetical protein ACTSXC_04630, partial [Candidatus Freyarchaeota archaeon]
ENKNEKREIKLKATVETILPESPPIIFSTHIVMTSALVVTLLLCIVSWKKPSLKRFSIPIVVAAWAVSTGFYIYAFCTLFAYIYLAEAILCVIALTISLQKVTGLRGK